VGIGGSMNSFVEVDTPHLDTFHAMYLIDKLAKKNDLDFDLSIAYDFAELEAGVYFPTKKKHSHRIFVNPLNCKLQDEIDANEEEPFYPGYSKDISLFGVVLHEFCHFLQHIIYTTIIKDYKEAFPIERFYLNEYSGNEIHDELAEIMTLYITNPYLLKLISKNHWKFCNKYFKSPVSCSTQRCAHIYKGFPIHIKKDMKERWKIVYNISSEKFERL
jgi:hypothetical protein